MSAQQGRPSRVGNQASTRPVPTSLVLDQQAATAQWPLGPNAPPSGGDGFTFEHLASKDELWWDFVADTGDGGDPTYA